MPFPPDIDRILRAVGKLETRLKSIAERRARLSEIIDDSKSTRREQIEHALTECPTQAELDHDDPFVKITAQGQDMRRDYAIQSLSAVVEFVAHGLERPDLDHALQDLWLALTNAAAGSKVAEDWLSRRPSKGAPRLPIEDEMMRGAIAAVQQILMDDGGLKREAAAKFAMRHFPHDILDPLFRNSPHANPGWKTVAEWRGGVIGKNVRDTRIWRLHSFRLHGQFPVSGKTPEQRAHSLIAKIIGAAKKSD